MKCIQSISDDSRILRVSDSHAVESVKTGNFRYVPKSLWKEKVRDVKPAKAEKEKETKKKKK